MSAYSVGMYDDPQTAGELKREIEKARQEQDRLIELNERALESDGHTAEGELRSPKDIGQWLRDCGFSGDVADFYAESVRYGHNVIVFQSDQRDEHFARVAREMRMREPSEVEQMLEQWSKGDREVFEMRVGRGETAAAEAGRGATGDGEQRVPITEERVTVGKAEKERGGVAVRTGVEEVQVEKEVTLREEKVGVERRAVERPLEAGERPFEEREIEVTERAEEPVVTKEARVVEEVTIGKETTERPVRVMEVVRRTTVDIDAYGGVDDERLRSEYEASGGGQRWEDYRAGARFGHAYGSREELEGAEYDEAEPALRERYEEREGKGAFDRARDSIRSWWHRARGKE